MPENPSDGWTEVACRFATRTTRTLSGAPADPAPARVPLVVLDLGSGSDQGAQVEYDQWNLERLLGPPARRRVALMNGFGCHWSYPTSVFHRALLAESLDRAVNGQSFRLIAYVFMPEHVHILIQPTAPGFRTDLFLKVLKAPFSTRIRKRLEEIR